MNRSHPLRVRGLKPMQAMILGKKIAVASFTGAWIETDWSQYSYGGLSLSHPLRVRGLKLGLTIKTGIRLGSRILYGCVDWNHDLQFYCCSLWSRILYGCVDWNKRDVFDSQGGKGRILYGCVDWNSISLFSTLPIRGRILYGCVDWNILTCTTPVMQ